MTTSGSKGRTNRDEHEKAKMAIAERDEHIASLQQRLRCIQMEKNQQEKALDKSKLECNALKEKFKKQLAERDENNMLELSLMEKNFERQISKQVEIFQKQLFDLTQTVKMQLMEREKSFEELLFDRNKLSECCVKWEAKVDRLEKVKMEELQCIQMENNQLQTALDCRRLECDALKETFTEQLAKRDECHRLELSQREKHFERQLSEQAKRFQKQLSDQTQNLKMQLMKREKSFEELLSDRKKLFECCSKWEEKVNQLQQQKKKELQSIQKEKNQLQIVLDESKLDCDALKEMFNEQLAERDEHHRFELSEREKNFERQLSEQVEAFKKQLSCQTNILRMELTEREKRFEVVVNERNELSEHCVDLVVKVDQLEEEKKKELQHFQKENYQLEGALNKSKLEYDALLEKVIELLAKKEETLEGLVFDRSKLSERCLKWEERVDQLEKTKKKALQCIQKDNNQLQKALDMSKLECYYLKDELIKHADRAERHRLELSRREKSFKQQLSEQAETFEKNFLERREKMKRHLCQKEHELQQVMEDNTQLQELLMEKQQKKTKFWGRIFSRLRKTPDT